jgi:threonine dehydrogenase-like Zn-dependent dehydrogenase
MDPSFVITHRLALEDAPQGYANFNRDKDQFVKIVLQPGRNN